LYGADCEKQLLLSLLIRLMQILRVYEGSALSEKTAVGRLDSDNWSCNEKGSSVTKRFAGRR
jgi:hypothetical protein